MGEVRELTQKIKRKAIELGFARVGVTTADPIEGYEEELCRRYGYGLWNAAIAMGNSGDARYLPALRRAMSEGSEQVRRYAKIAVDRIEAETANESACPQ